MAEEYNAQRGFFKKGVMKEALVHCPPDFHSTLLGDLPVAVVSGLPLIGKKTEKGGLQTVLVCALLKLKGESPLFIQGE